MGTINYGSNNYINIGINPDLYENDEKYFEIDFIYEIISEIREKYDFYFYHVTIQPGYYEGFYIDIENNFSIFFDDYLEKKEALKEITQLKLFLIECINEGLVKYAPGWGTGYYNTTETITALKEVIKNMRLEIKLIPTAKQYFKGEKQNEKL